MDAPSGRALRSQIPVHAAFFQITTGRQPGRIAPICFWRHFVRLPAACLAEQHAQAAFISFPLLLNELIKSNFATGGFPFSPECLLFWIPPISECGTSRRRSSTKNWISMKKIEHDNESERISGLCAIRLKADSTTGKLVDESRRICPALGRDVVSFCHAPIT
jgi:hypothetical protein